MTWRQGSKISLNVYDTTGRPICQCHHSDDAAAIVAVMNAANAAIRNREVGGAGTCVTCNGTGIASGTLTKEQRERGMVHRTVACPSCGENG